MYIVFNTFNRFISFRISCMKYKRQIERSFNTHLNRHTMTKTYPNQSMVRKDINSCKDPPEKLFEQKINYKMKVESKNLR